MTSRARRRRTGEQPQIRMPLRIDRLPQATRDKIQELRAKGRTWEEIEAVSESFAGQRLPRSSLARWYDLRVEQVQREVLARAHAAREFASSFKTLGFDELPEATRNALASQVFVLFEQIGNDAAARKELGNLLFLLLKSRQLDIKQEEVKAKTRELEMRIEEMKRKAAGATRQIEKAAAQGKRPPEDAVRALKELYGL